MFYSCSKTNPVSEESKQALPTDIGMSDVNSIYTKQHKKHFHFWCFNATFSNISDISWY